jgi:methylphosphotriester-DNA--protein-cysteine methyltransferase
VTACSDHYVEPVEERIFPDGAVHLIFNIGTPPTGERGADLRCLAMGATLGPTTIVLAGAIDQVCVRLGVGDAAAVLGAPANAVTDHGVSLEDLWGTAASELLEDLAGARADTRQGLVEDALRVRIARANRPARVVRVALQRIARMGGAVRVRDLVDELGVSERRLQQLFLEHVGLSPKQMCRLARFRSVVGRWRERRDSWSALALAAGYYDQAHLVNDLRSFTGLTPTRLDDFGFFQEPVRAAS